MLNSFYFKFISIFSKYHTQSFSNSGQSFIIDKDGAAIGRKISNTIPLLMKVRTYFIIERWLKLHQVGCNHIPYTTV